MTKNRFAKEALLGAALLLAACGGDAGEDGDAVDKGAPGGNSVAAAGDSARPAGQTVRADGGPTVELAPNELGRIMVLEYHRIGDNEGEFVRSLAHFRNDLRLLYENGYRPITMRNVLEGNINVPAGTTPVVFVFDDSTLGQFYYLADGSIDPNTMVGSWESFRAQNPAWNGGATWCVLPAAGHPSNFFSEKPDREFASREEREANIRKKVGWLVENGHELCNHTYYHARLDRGTDREVQDWLGIGEDSIKAYLPPDYDIVTMALPLGMWPQNRSLAWTGTYRDGKRYEYKVVMEVAGGPSVSPYDRAWDPHSVDRFIVAPGALERQIERWKENPENRFVSDGDPDLVSYPQRAADRVDPSKLGGRRTQVVPDAPAPAADSAPSPGAQP